MSASKRGSRARRTARTRGSCSGVTARRSQSSEARRSSFWSVVSPGLSSPWRSCRVPTRTPNVTPKPKPARRFTRHAIATRALGPMATRAPGRRFPHRGSSAERGVRGVSARMSSGGARGSWRRAWSRRSAEEPRAREWNELHHPHRAMRSAARTADPRPPRRNAHRAPAPERGATPRGAPREGRGLEGGSSWFGPFPDVVRSVWASQEDTELVLCPRHTRLRGRDSDIENPCDLLPGEALESAQDHHGAQILGERRDRARDPIALLTVGHDGFGTRAVVPLPSERLLGADEGPAPAAPTFETDVRRDPIEPGRDTAPSLESLETSMHAEEDLLSCVLGLVGADVAENDPVNRVGVLEHELAEGRGVSGRGSGREPHILVTLVLRGAGQVQPLARLVRSHSSGKSLGA